MIVLLRPRLIYLAIFLACAGLMGFGLYLQHVENLEPCPLCILQRYAFIATGLVALIAAIQGPGKVGRWLYAVLIVAAAGSGAIVAGRQGTRLRAGPRLHDRFVSHRANPAQSIQGRR